MDELTIKTINNERQRYVDFFVEATNALKGDKESFATELTIKINDQSITEPFDLVRVDFIYKDKNGENAMNEIRLDKNLVYDKLDFRVNDSKVTIGPFCWNSCEMTVDNFDNEGLKNWIWKWIKVDSEANGQISEAIHSCTSPDDNKFIIDFGTSTELSLIDLIDTLTRTGTKELNIETSVV